MEKHQHWHQTLIGLYIQVLEREKYNGKIDGKTYAKFILFGLYRIKILSSALTLKGF